MTNFSGYHLDLQWYDYMRFATASMAISAFYMSINRARENWGNYTQRLRELLYVFNGLLFLSFYGSIEQILTHEPLGTRNVLSFILMIAALRAVHRKEGYLVHEVNE